MRAKETVDGNRGVEDGGEGEIMGKITEKQQDYLKKPLSWIKDVAQLNKGCCLISMRDLPNLVKKVGCSVRCSEKQMLKSPVKLLI